MHGLRRITSVPIMFLIIVALLLAAAFGVYASQAQDSDRALGELELLDHSGNPNDDKDDCPHDGNAGGGNDDKGPNGGCRPPKGEYGRVR